MVVGPSGPVLAATKTDRTHSTDLDAATHQPLDDHHDAMDARARTGSRAEPSGVRAQARPRRPQAVGAPSATTAMTVATGICVPRVQGTLAMISGSAVMRSNVMFQEHATGTGAASHPTQTRSGRTRSESAPVHVRSGPRAQP